MVVIKPLYGIAEAGAHWWSTYFKHHCERLQIVISTYDPCLLMTNNSSGYFVTNSIEYIEQHARGAYLATIC